jgi:hypothetical protein
MDYAFAFIQHQQLFDMFVAAGFLNDVDIKKEKEEHHWVNHKLDINKAENSILMHNYWTKKGYIFRLKLEREGIKLVQRVVPKNPQKWVQLQKRVKSVLVVCVITNNWALKWGVATRLPGNVNRVSQHNQFLWKECSKLP